MLLELSEEETMILNVIIRSSKSKVITSLEEWFHHIKSIFVRLPSDADLIYKATKIVEEYRFAKEDESKNETSEDADDEASEMNETNTKGWIDNKKD